MKSVSNKDMLNAIRNEASAEYQDKVPVVMDDRQARAILDTLQNYPTIRNEFIQGLTNKVVKTEFFSKVYDNPLKMLKKGSLPYGSSVEELFVNAATAKGFYTNNFNNHNAEVGEGDQTHTELLSKAKPDIRSLYITKNFAHVFKTSISDAQLKGAFLSQNGLSELVNQLVGSLQNGAEQKEYKDMKNLLFAAAQCKMLEGGTDGAIADGEGSYVAIPTNAAGSSNAKTYAGVRRRMYLEKLPQITAEKNLGKEIVKKVRELTGTLKFVNAKYNMAGVDTFTATEDLVFVTTPKYAAEIDVEVLASAFNVSKAEIAPRIILVDELPKKFCKGANQSGPETEGWYTTSPQNISGDNVVCYGILMDRNFIQAIDTVNESRTFDNGRTLTQNVFLHRQGIMSTCYFANCIALVDSATTITPESK